MGCALAIHKEGLQSSVLRAGMCQWAIAPPRCGLLAVDHSREATFIAAAGFAVATLPFVNSPTAGIPSLRHLGAQALALDFGSTATASTNR